MIGLLAIIAVACLLWPFAASIGEDFASADFDHDEGSYTE